MTTPTLLDAARPFADGYVADDAMCHVGVCSTSECHRCSTILALRAAIAREEERQEIIEGLVEAARRFDYAPDGVPNQDEMGGCVFCGGTPPGEPYGYTESADDHESDCAWLVLHAALARYGAMKEDDRD